MDAQAVDESGSRPLGSEENAHRLAPFERDHAAAAPEVEVADEALETVPVKRRRVRILRSTAALPGLDEETDVVGTAEAIGCHEGRMPVAGSRSDRGWTRSCTVVQAYRSPG